MLDFFTNRIAVTQLVGLLFAALAAFHVIVPATVNPANSIAVILLASTAVSAILRFSHPGDGSADAKVWWQSRTIWTQLVAAGFAGTALIGYVPATDEAHVLETVMTLVALVSMALGKSISSPINFGGKVQCAPLAIAGAIILALTVGGCASTGLSTPAAIASQAVGSADAAYIAASTAGSALAASGVITKERFHELDNQAYAALLSLRQTALAVRTGALPPASIQTATANLNAALATLRTGQ